MASSSSSSLASPGSASAAPSPPSTPPAVPPSKSGSPQCEPGLDSFPDDVALGIASFLGAGDLCSLGSCSRFWRLFCSSDGLWAPLCAQRWPPRGPPSSGSLGGVGATASTTPSAAEGATAFPFAPPAQGWKSFYIRCHQEMAGRILNVIKFVNDHTKNESMEVGDYLKAVASLHLLKVGFGDIKFCLLTVKHNVLLNLVGLHYMIFYLKVPGIDVLEALHSAQISERQVRVNWFKLGRWFYGFRLPDESRSCKVSLWGVATSEEEVRSVLNRGAIHEVLRVQIASVTSTTS